MVPYKGQKLVPCMSDEDPSEKTKVCNSACIGCEDCVRNCPNGAIYMKDRHAVIDHTLCENCTMCQYVCRNNVIKELSVPEYIYRQREALRSEEGGKQE